MMHRVKFRGLDEVAQPARRSHIGVIEILASSSEEVVPKGAQQRATQQGIEHQRAQNCVGEDLDGMFIERRH